MIDITTWMNNFSQKLIKTFDNRVWFLGLQGSYSRGEATDKSDIDVVVILDELSLFDIQTYNKLIDDLPHRELICGFLSGKKEIFNWEPSDLLQFYYDTTPILGSLDELVTLFDDTVIDRAIKIGACNIFHTCVHNMLYEKSEDVLRELYKSASFVVQAVYFKQTKVYIRKINDLLKVIPQNNRVIINTFLSLKNGANVNFSKMSETLFLWCKGLIVA